MAKLIDLDGLAYFYGKIKAMLADKLGKKRYGSKCFKGKQFNSRNGRTQKR